MDTKVCSKCKQVKSVDLFTKRNDRPGYKSTCKACRCRVRPRTITLLGGQSGVGKTTLTAKLTHKFTVISKDTLKDRDLIELINNTSGNILYETPVMISTTVKLLRNAGFTVRLVLLIEDIDVIKTRLTARGSTRLDNVEKRHKRLARIAELATPDFVGNFDECFNYLK